MYTVTVYNVSHHWIDYIMWYHVHSDCIQCQSSHKLFSQDNWFGITTFVANNEIMFSVALAYVFVCLFVIYIT